MGCNKKKGAFTLTELLVVVLVLGVLAGVAVPKFKRVLETRKTEEAVSILAAVRNEQEKRCVMGQKYLGQDNSSKLAALAEANTSKHYTYSLQSTGASAQAKGADYTLKILSYQDGSVCCEGNDCTTLNKNYPTCGNAPVEDACAASTEAAGNQEPESGECHEFTVSDYFEIGSEDGYYDAGHCTVTKTYQRCPEEYTIYTGSSYQTYYSRDTLISETRTCECDDAVRERFSGNVNIDIPNGYCAGTGSAECNHQTGKWDFEYEIDYSACHCFGGYTYNESTRACELAGSTCDESQKPNYAGAREFDAGDGYCVTTGHAECTSSGWKRVEDSRTCYCNNPISSRPPYEINSSFTEIGSIGAGSDNTIYFEVGCTTINNATVCSKSTRHTCSLQNDTPVWKEDSPELASCECVSGYTWKADQSKCVKSSSSSSSSNYYITATRTLTTGDYECYGSGIAQEYRAYLVGRMGILHNDCVNYPSAGSSCSSPSDWMECYSSISCTGPAGSNQARTFTVTGLQCVKSTGVGSGS